MVRRWIVAWALVAGLCAGSAMAQDDAPYAPELRNFQVREGYSVSLAADGLKGARFLAFDPLGRLYVSRPRVGDVVCLWTPDANGFYLDREQFVTGKATVQAMSWHDGWMYFATTNAVYRGRDTTGDGKADDVEEVISPGKLPFAGQHWWRSLLVTGDAIYTSIGDSSDCTDELTSSDRQKIWKWNLAGTEKTLFSTGIRNTEKLLMRPGTGELWGCDHGSDMFGRGYGETDSVPITDTNPPDEFNHYEQGKFYGHPFLVGNRVPRPEYRDRKDLIALAERTTVPAWCFGAHWAPNAFCFIDPAINDRTRAFPADHDGDAFVCFHGSWNSTTKVGYQVSRVIFDKDPKLGGKPCGQVTIVSTLQANSEIVLGRPVDCVQAPDGSVLFSDDMNGRVYRIRWVGPKAE